MEVVAGFLHRAVQVRDHETFFLSTTVEMVH